MRSSTSNSRSARVRTARVALALFALAFTLCFAAGKALARPGAWLAYAWPNPDPDDLPAGSWYPHFRRGSDVGSHALLYHAAGPSIDNARAADLLFLGNSRMGMGLTVASQRAFSERSGIASFNLTFGHGEAYRFPLRILERHALWPPLIVVNADRFFANTLSGPAVAVLRDSAWERTRDAFEERLARRWTRASSAHFPHFTTKLPAPLEWRAEDVWTIFRSEDDGSWFPWHLPSINLPVDPSTGADALLDAELEAARAFVERVHAQGSALVLSLVPTRNGDGSYTRAQELARRLDVPLVAPRLEGLITYDGSHLDSPSAQRWSEAFFAALEREPVARRALGLD